MTDTIQQELKYKILNFVSKQMQMKTISYHHKPTNFAKFKKHGNTKCRSSESMRILMYFAGGINRNDCFEKSCFITSKLVHTLQF